MSLGAAKFMIVLSIALLLIGVVGLLLGDQITGRSALLLGALGLFFGMRQRRKLVSK